MPKIIKFDNYAYAKVNLPKIFKDGDKIEVDAIKGVVRKL